ncbi:MULTISPECIES: hypothetical protein [Rhizobium]|uniref:hypothetical protein n=1 Tax=Rhizobium TaxID=379 RepID=UPI0023613FAF|nr:MULTISPECIES: hypothetical protein [unclassified Rhizobium]WEA24377.1 hypothetical protein PO862_14890 [Rhizobium sp. MJ22]WEA58892.1 hypothetical protein PO860_14465 [Rhizobium sp. BJ04]
MALFAMQARENEARLEALLLEGLASGDAVEATPAFWNDLRKEAVELLATRGKKKSL